MQTLILASKSQRRIKIMKKIFSSFNTIKALEPEDIVKLLNAREHTRRMAEYKAVWIALRNPNSIIIASDTLVEIDHKKLQKPKNAKMAKKYLEMISSKKFCVYTSTCICYFGIKQKMKCTKWTKKCNIKCKKLTRKEINDYIKTDLWREKAGGFNILQKPASTWFFAKKNELNTIAGLDDQGLIKRAKKINALAYLLKKNH